LIMGECYRMKIVGRLKYKFVSIFVVIILGVGVIPVHSQSRINNLEQPIHTIDYEGYSGNNLDKILKPGEALVKFETDIDLRWSKGAQGLSTGIQSIDSILENYHIVAGKRLFSSLSPQLSTWYWFAGDPQVDVCGLVDRLKTDPNVVYAEPNLVYSAFSMNMTPNDPMFPQQWALNQLNGVDINAPEAWMLEQGSLNVTIAIVDTGINYTHPDLAANMWMSTNGSYGYDFVNNDLDPMDDCGHGTFCAGIASAVTNNSIGIAGTCWNCKLMAVKGLNSDGSGATLNLSRCIVYAVDNGAEIISMSWGGTFSYVIRDAVNYGYSHGVTLVSAAGNTGHDEKVYPAAHENVIAVAALCQNNTKADFSTFGSWVDVAAPGIDILSTTFDGGYGTADGTSVACPFVAGIAALLVSRYPDCPCLPQMIQTVISYTTDPVNTTEYIGTGRVNAYFALLQDPFAAVLDSIDSWEDTKGIVNLTGASWGDGLRYFTLSYGIGENPGSWIEIANLSDARYGVLTSWDSTQADEGLVTFRLNVVFDNVVITKNISLYINNQADGTYSASIYVSNCYDPSTPGWGTTHFATIQDGIDKATKDQTIFVYDGLYNEDLTIKGYLKPIQIIGQSQRWTIVLGSVNVSYAMGVTFGNFSLRGLGTLQDQRHYLWFAICLYRSFDCLLSDLIITNFYATTAVVLLQSSHNIMTRLNFTAIFYAQMLSYDVMALHSSSNNMIFDNYFKLNMASLYLWKSRQNTISNNTFIENGGSITITNSNNNKIIYNYFDNNGKAIGLSCFFGKICQGNIIAKNLFINNSICIETAQAILGQLINNKIIANEFRNNTIGFYNYYSVRFNFIYYNNFVGNGRHAADEGRNIWNKHDGLLHGHGNYWDDYNGTDADGDGIGDTPYKGLSGIPELPGKKLVFDRFPLMTPVDIYNITIPELLH
jgi:thermitase